MKKLYTIALMCGTLVFGANAAQRSQAVTVLPQARAFAKNVRSIDNAQLTANRAPKAKAAEATALNSGMYDFTYTWLLNSTSTINELELTITDATTGEVTISGFPQGFELKATYDAAAGTLSIANKQDLGTDSYGDQNYFYIKGVDGNQVTAGATDAEATVGTISGTTITFPSTDIWTIGDYEDEALGYWWMSYNNKMKWQDPNADPNEGWTSLGNATLVDGWLLPVFDMDQTAEENQWEVELQQNDDNKNVYRLVDPYKGNCPVAAYNESTAKHGYIQFDVTDPDHVTFEAVNAGFANEELELSEFYCINMLSFYIEYFGYDAATIVGALDDQIPYTTYKDGVVTLTATEESAGDWYSDACFGDQEDPWGGYSWLDASQNYVNMFTQITFPKEDGIQSVAVEAAATGAAEYFNLQGVRVAEPAAGLYIRRQGNDVAKVVIR